MDEKSSETVIGSDPKSSRNLIPSHKLDLQKTFATRSDQVGTGIREDVILQDLGLGLGPGLDRTLSSLGILSAGWNICNSWAAVAATLAIGIAQGGSATLIYGIFLIVICDGCVAATIAELASVYPTAGGQYHWTSILAPYRWSAILSYICGAANIFSWITIAAGLVIIPAQFVFAIAIQYNTSYIPQSWHYFMLYQVLNIIGTCYNVFAIGRIIWLYTVSFALSMALFLVVTIICPVMSPTKQSNEFVWSTFTNNSGWSSDGVVFLTGLITPNYIYCGIDGAIHLAEECTNAAVAVPRALMSIIGIGAVTSLVFTVAMLYSTVDFDAILGTPTGVPIYEVWSGATMSTSAASVFLCVLTALAVVGLICCQQTASRLLWTFARDDAIILSKFIKRIHPIHQVPVWALIFNGLVIFVIGCVYLGSSTAFNAIIGTGLVLQHISFSIPSLLLLYRGRSEKYLPHSRPFNIGWFGWIANVITVAFGLLVLVFYNLPVVLPVSGSNMNYTSAVIGCMALFAIVNWFGYAKEYYKGPRLL